MAARDETMYSDNVYNFPVYNNTSVRFVVKGAKIKHAVLIVGESKLGTIRPEYDDEWTPETMTKLDFFGETPFRASLTMNLNPVLRVTTSGVPTIMMEVIQDGISWETVGEKYSEPVTVSTAAGEKKLNIVYLKNKCGYEKP